MMKRAKLLGGVTLGVLLCRWGFRLIEDLFDDIETTEVKKASEKNAREASKDEETVIYLNKGIYKNNKKRGYRK
jgi:hypothetical protein